jgi:hypothetical protein
VPFDPTPGGGENARAGSSWLWPGRFLLDALQHRWGKWVLDYSLQDQVEVLGRAAAALRREDAGESPDGSGRTGLLFAVGALMVAGAVLLAAGRRAPAGTPETRLYLGLVASARRAGLVRGAVAPLELVERIRSFGGGAEAPASRLVGLYLRARFAAEELREGERAEMSRALRDARRALSERQREVRAAAR